MRNTHMLLFLPIITAMVVFPASTGMAKPIQQPVACPTVCNISEVDGGYEITFYAKTPLGQYTYLGLGTTVGGFVGWPIEYVTWWCQATSPIEVCNNYNIGVSLPVPPGGAYPTPPSPQCRGGTTYITGAANMTARYSCIDVGALLP